MNSALMFSKASDEWSTPQALFDELNAEFKFALDAAATRENAKCELYLGPDMGTPYDDALTLDSWWLGRRPDTEAVWLNPPYSKCREFIARAADEARRGLTVVCLVPSRTDTRWFHDHVWEHDKPRAGVEVRFLKGRVKFQSNDGSLIRKGHSNSAPFPSVVIIFRGAK